ncbi:Transposase_IS4 [Hexamita inflata]|uniref:Transposase IS4 n=1 Tax=Hexamita inflata TaxID=28002 RepID=A0AA86RA35_9EUKA|nr:Transposase IS4 [Hexamita inflata]
MVYRYGAGENMSLDELYCMLSIILTMCIHPNKDIQDHWSNSGLLCNPFIKETLPRNQFLQLWYNLRFCDHRNPVSEVQETIPDKEDDGYESEKFEAYLKDSTNYEKEHNIDPALKRVQSLSNELIKLWKIAFARNIPTSKKFRFTIDESLLFFNGRVIFKVFNPMKPAE